MIFKDFEKEPVGYGRFKMCDVKKEFEDKTSSKHLFSSKIEIFGIKWCVGIENKNNQILGIYLYRKNKEE